MILPNLNVHDVCFVFFLRDVAQTTRYGYPICSNFDGGTFLDVIELCCFVHMLRSFWQRTTIWVHLRPPQGFGAVMHACPKNAAPLLRESASDRNGLWGLRAAIR